MATSGRHIARVSARNVAISFRRPRTPSTRDPLDPGPESEAKTDARCFRGRR